MHYCKHVVTTEMPKCYAISLFEGSDQPSFVIGCEKQGPLRRFGLDGRPLETIAEGPGGVMSIVQVPGRRDQLLATAEFFSPNYGGDHASIMLYTNTSTEDQVPAWQASVLCKLPYVHRFGLVRAADGRLWLIACTIKGSCREVKNDWYVPGAVYAAVLEGDLSRYSEDNPLQLEVIASEQVQNHGFFLENGGASCLIGTAAGVFRYVPPADKDKSWTIRCLLVQPTSDMCLADLDGDGHAELVTLSSFHGDTLRVYHETNDEFEGRYELVWEDATKRGFLHAIWASTLANKPCVILGHRKDDRDLLRLYEEAGTYELEMIDHDRGPTNCLVFGDEAGEHIIATNRETDEVALYTICATER